MGDTGSMILGFILAVFAVRYIDNSEHMASSAYSNASPIVVLAILFFPLLDTLRIFFIRLVIHKKSPFSADRNHIHHRFLSLGFTHIQTTAIIVIINAVLIGIALGCKDLDIHLQLAILLGSGTILYSVYFNFKWLRSLQKN